MHFILFENASQDVGYSLSHFYSSIIARDLQAYKPCSGGSYSEPQKQTTLGASPDL